MGKKLKTKSILACAVLASVLGGGFFVSVAEATDVKAIVTPKDFVNCTYINGKEVTFGQKRGYSSNQFEITDHQKVKVFNENPTWQVVGTAAGEFFLLANQSWGINRFSDYGIYNPFVRQNIRLGQFYWREALNLLNDRKSIFFSADELAYLDTQISYEQEKETGHVGVITNEYSGVFALPKKELVDILTTEQIKRDEAYWLNDSEIVDIRTTWGTYKEFYWNVDVVNEDGSITKHNGTETKEIYPTLKLKSVLFAYLGDKSVPSSKFVTSADDSSALHITFKNTNKEKNVQVQELSVAKDKMTITATGLATGEGQGLSGILSDSSGYIAYARLADSSGNGRAENVHITNGTNQFVDSSKIINGNYILQLFNEKVATNSAFDYAGNFNKVGQVGLENGVITNFSLSGDRTYSSLEIGEGVGFNFTAVNREGGEGFGAFWQIESEAIKVTDSLSWYNVLEAQGTITLKGSIKVENKTLILERPENMPIQSREDKGIVGWNDITYDGGAGQSATLHVNGNMHGLIVNGGTFKTEQDLTLTDYLQVNNGSVAVLQGDVKVKNVQIAENGLVKIENGKEVSVGKSLSLGDGAKIVAASGTGKLTMADGLEVRDKITLENIEFKVDNIRLHNDINMTGGTLKVGKSLSMQNGIEQNGTINNLTFGDDSTGNQEAYYFDVGFDELQISGTATGKVKLVPKYGVPLTDNSQVDVFTVSGSGNLNGLILSDSLVTDKANNQTYFLTQNKENNGKLDVKASRHNAVVNFVDCATNGSKVNFGNLGQIGSAGGTPVVWDVVRNDYGKVILFSEKILAQGTADMHRLDKSVPLTSFMENFDYKHVKGNWMHTFFTNAEAGVFNYKLVVPTNDDIKENGNFNLTAEQRKASAVNGVSMDTYGIGNTYECTNYYFWWALRQVDSNGALSENGFSDVGIRPAMQFDSDMVLFASNTENGRATIPVGKANLLQSVTASSSLELLFDDAHVAEKTGTGRVTGDVNITDLYLNGSNLNVAYNGGRYVDGNSYLSYFVGEDACPRDYFAYGKADMLGRYGSGVSGNIPLMGIAASSAMANKNMTLSFFNEYGNGTSFAGEFKVLPGNLKLDTFNNLTYTVAVGDMAQHISMGKNNVVELTGTGELTKNITGTGVVKALNDGITATGDRMLVDFETASGKTMNISGGDVKGSLKGSFNLTGNTTFSGKKLQGVISGGKKLTLNNDVQINGDLNIANLDGNSKTLNMQQTDGTATYDTLTIGTLKDNANWAIDVDLVNRKSDKIVLNSVDTGKIITLNAINLVGTLTDDITTIGGVVNGAAKDSVNVASSLFVYDGGKKYSVTLAENGSVKDLQLNYIALPDDAFKDFIKSEVTASYSLTEDTILDETVTTGSAGSAKNITKTVFLNDKTLSKYSSGSSDAGITVANTHTLAMMNGTISGFDTALTVNKTDANNFGTLTLGNVTFENNTTADVANAGTMNILGSVTMQTLTGSGTTEIKEGAVLNLGNATAETPQIFEQTFQGDGTLNFKGNASVAADKLNVSKTNIGNEKKLTLTGGSDGTNRKTLQSTISGDGSIEIGTTNFIQTDANNLQVAVANAGDLKISGANIGTIAKGITGNGSLEFAQNVRIDGAISQNNITVDARAALDVYNTLEVTSGSITNNGSICINAGNLQSDVTNYPDGNTFTVDGYTMYNGAVYLYSSGTPESSTLTKKITNGKAFVMNDVISSLQNLATGTLDGAGVYLAGGANLILKGTAEETIGINIKGYESLDALYAGTGTLVTDGNYTTDLDKVQVPLENRRTMNLNKGTSISDMRKMTGIANSGDLNVGTGISVTGIITNTNNVTLASGATFGAGGKVVGGTLNLGDNIVFSSANLEGLTELQADNAIYNFNAELGAEPGIDIIDAGKVTGTLKLGTVTPTWNENLSEWELGTTKIVPYLKDNTGNTVAVGNTAVIFSEDNHRFTFSQAKEDNGTDKIGYLAIVKENGGELWQIIRNMQVGEYHCGNVSTYSLTADYTEQMKDATTDTDKLGTLTRTDTTPRELTIEGNGHSFDGNGKNGITVQNAGDILNFSNISDIKGWNEYVVSNSGSLNFNGANVLNSKITGTGTFNNNGYLKVADVSNLPVTELHNTSIVDIGNGTDQTLNTKINGGILGIVGNISANAANLAANEIDIAENKTLTVTGDTLGETFVINLGSLNLATTTSNAFVVGGIVSINSNVTTTQPIMADAINLDTNTLTVTGADDNTEFVFGKINANDGSELDITRGKVTAHDEINSKIKLGDNVDLTIAADNIKKGVEIGNSAKLNLGDGTLKTTTITGTNSGTVNFLGNVKVDTGTSIPKVTFADGSVLTVEARTDTAPVEVTQTISVDPGAKLFVDGAEKGKTYKIISGAAVEDSFIGWTLSNISGEDADGRHVKAKDFVVADNVYSIVFRSVVPENTMLKNILANNYDAPITEFAEQIADKYYDADDAIADALATNEINSVAALGENLGVSRGAYDVANMVGDAIEKHWDDNRVQDSGFRIQEKRKVWASGTHNKETLDGVELGGMKAQYDAQYNGAVVGVNWSGNFGMAINYTDGKVNNHLGGHNDAEYYGGSLYAKTDWGNLRITADATYTYGKNELSQNGITADAKTETISGGLTLKYMAKAGLNKIGPFAGIRYMHIKGRDYTDSLGINREADTINSMVVPVGLEYTAEFKMPKSEWTWKPMLMAGYLFNLGDRTNDMFLSYNNAMDSFAYDFVDKGAFFAKAGMAFEKKNFSLGISYDFMKSKNSKNRRWNVNADVMF